MNLRKTERPASLQRGKGFMYGLGAFGVGFALLLVYIGFTAPNKIPGRGYYTLQAQLTNADNISKHAQVRLHGKLVGQVLNPRVENGIAIVDLQLDPKYGPLKSDTRVEVRPRSPVGVRYVDLTAGERGTPLQDGATIPASQSRATVQLDEVLGTFDPKTRVRARQFLTELGGGFAGRGADLNDAIGAAPRFLVDTDEVLGTLARRTDAFGSLIRGSAAAAAAAEPVRNAIAAGFRPEADALKPFAEERSDVQATLDAAPPALRTASSRLPGIGGFVRELAGFAHNVRPALAAAPASMAQTSALLRESRPGLRAANTTLKTLGRAVAPTLTLLDRVRPVLPNVDDVLGQVTPLVDTLGAYNCDMKQLGDWWHDALSAGSEQGNVMKFDVVTPNLDGLYGNNTSLLDGLTGALNNPYPSPGCTTGPGEYARGGN